MLAWEISKETFRKDTYPFDSLRKGKKISKATKQIIRFHVILWFQPEGKQGIQNSTLSPFLLT